MLPYMKFAEWSTERCVYAQPVDCSSRDATLPRNQQPEACGMD